MNSLINLAAHRLYSFPSNLLKLSLLRLQNIRHCQKFHQQSQVVKTFRKEMNTFSLNDYDCIGFDLDNTLVKYNVKNMIYHEYNVLADFLISKGYSKEYLLNSIEENSDFLQKGLILDFERGNLLRICPDGSIQIGSHGTKFLTKHEIIEIYGDKKRWEVTDKYCQDMLIAWNGTLADHMRTCLDYFDMPAALAFARIVDSIDAKKGERQEKYNIWPDILSGKFLI
jgi:5' nucleotidase family